jgi:branched-chain amino acid transport system substrate-binding protein
MLHWLSLGVALAAAVLLVVGCKENKEEPSTTPGATARVPGPTLTAEASDTTGVTDTEIKIGAHFPLSGNPAAAYAPIAYGIRAYFDFVNDHGGIYGRKINYLIGDDHYNPPDTVEVVRKLVEDDKVFAMVGGLGEDTHSSVWKYLEEKGVPDMFPSTGLAKWSDPVVRTRFAANPDYITEGFVLGQHIVKTYPGKKVGFLLQNDELGQEGEKGLRQAIEGSSVTIADVERYDVIVSDVTSQTQRLKNAGVDVIAAYTIPPQGASMVKAARETLNWDVPFVLTGIDNSDIFVALAGAQNCEGIVSTTFGPQISDTDQRGVQLHTKILEKYGRGIPPSNFGLYGSFIGEMTVHILEMAGPDLTRGSFLDAAESVCNWECSTCSYYGNVNMSPTDHRPIEVLVYTRVENGKWVVFGDPVGYESTKDCTPPTPPPGYENQPQIGDIEKDTTPAP